MRYTGPKNRIARREAMDLGLKTPGTKSHASLLRRLNVLPGQQSIRRRKISEHGKQLREKQKLRYIFGVTESQMKNYFKKAKSKLGNTGLYLSQYLEQRLDNVVYKLGFAPTRASARQLVSHGHIKVNEHIVTVSSYQVKTSNVIAFTNSRSEKIPYIENLLSKKEIIIPDWLEKKGTVGKMISTPSAENIEKQINLRSVIEFYSR
ncbi:MAG: 30S ribosomal protein S4 [Candidatus Roizmanbacteria bacterium]|nr:MAG: 30S ribosomal protein S4 [Candidatus Roizmanbacteria bacterium]